MRRMLSVRSSYRRSDWYLGARFDPKYDNVGSQRDEALHTKLRAKMAGGVSLQPQIVNSTNMNLVLWKRGRKLRDIGRRERSVIVRTC